MSSPAFHFENRRRHCEWMTKKFMDRYVLGDVREPSQLVLSFRSRYEGIAVQQQEPCVHPFIHGFWLAELFVMPFGMNCASIFYKKKGLIVNQ